ncbi:MAG: glycosyltransferase family 4 protein [Alphaproteobacteria bacterium]|nr:glycosyltransferase family 4 protein [Alphaproteobacteria bacterium]
MTRVAFACPLHGNVSGLSGDRKVARLMREAMERAGFMTETFSIPRLYAAMPKDQGARLAEGQKAAKEIIRTLMERPARERPRLWFTYHCYYRAPDVIGPPVARALNIPLVIAEASDSPTKEETPWAAGLAASREAIGAAAAVFYATARDYPALARRVEPARLHALPPFIDPLAYWPWRIREEEARALLSSRLDLPLGAPLIVTAAMMRPRKKQDSYRALAETLLRLKERRWHLLVAGDGPARRDVEEALGPLGRDRIHLAGAIDESLMPMVFGAGAIHFWPGIGEAYGMVYLEAAAAGRPSVAWDMAGVASVVRNDVTGLLAPAGDGAALADRLAALLDDAALRARLGRAGADWTDKERSLDAAAARLRAGLEGLV